MGAVERRRVSVMGRDGRNTYDGHNRKPQKTSMRNIASRRRRRKARQNIRQTNQRPWEGNE